ncbi:N-acyl-L-homoserine lactone synthetase [Alphaproteobacteria bacterium KMM 3653]|uniref:N-acyl-L-homoserine lactone synthetase n=1 Tax=Harenicola maris TaxID=2841044 RepID=A0AAP2CLL2_9RHOB|nr:N-acyl-L-homoserine lactone synthetase [Harenicola maris]
MQTTTLSFANIHDHGELFANFMRERHQSFIVQKEWDLPQAMGMEYDQYDTPASRWIAVHEFGEVLAGIRLTPTTNRCGIYSYMIRDAQRGLLGTIPSDLLYEDAPIDPNIWETSRVFVNHKVPDRSRNRVRLQLAGALTKSARELGASHILALTMGVWPRMFRLCKLEATAAGPVLEIDGDKTQVVSIDLSNKLH